MRRHGLAGMFVAALLGGGACGSSGAGQEAREPAAAAPAANEESTDEPADEDVLIPGEKIDAIQSFFERKNRVISHCFSDAMEAGEISGKTSRVHVTVQLTITEDGRPSDLSVAEANVSSPALESCIFDYVERWTLPTLPKPLDYSYTFGFSAL